MCKLSECSLHTLVVCESISRMLLTTVDGGQFAFSARHEYPINLRAGLDPSTHQHTHMHARTHAQTQTVSLSILLYSFLTLCLCVCVCVAAPQQWSVELNATFLYFII